MALTRTAPWQKGGIYHAQRLWCLFPTAFCMETLPLGTRLGDPFKTWTAKFDHPIENPDANLDVCFLIFQVARL